MVYKTKGTCSSEIEFEVENGILTDIHFVGGCQGNTTGVAALAKGLPIDEVIDKLSGIQCGFRGTSCPDQLSKALIAYKENNWGEKIMKRIVLTGGGTAGHVTPNMALVPKLIDEGYNIYYIGSYEGMEKKLIEDIGVTYYGISSGKLRRYFDIKNFSDPFRVIKGFFEAKKILKKLRPDVVFSKGGFVTVPVVIAAKQLHIPVIINESDMTPGLAFTGKCDEGLRLCGFTEEKPVLLVIGGSLGSVAINNAIRSNIDALLEKYQIIHLCGRNNLDESLEGREGYKQFEYVKDELKHYFACANVVVSRAGANAICELLALRKPNILIPLGLEASRGDQILNAESFENQGYSYVLQEKDVTSETLLNAVNSVYEDRDKYIEAMNHSKLANPIETIVNLANQLASRKKKR